LDGQHKAEDEVQHSEALDQLAAAMAKVQAALKPALKDSQNPFFKSSYADLSSVWEAAKEPLNKNGLSVIQGFGQNSGDGFLWTMLLHQSGQWIMGECPLILVKRDPQGVGSAGTYARRYGLAAILGITQTDDDGESAVDHSHEAPTAAKPAAGPNAAPSFGDLSSMLANAKDSVQLKDAWFFCVKHQDAVGPESMKKLKAIWTAQAETLSKS
jgi:hypothetical protein